MNHHHIGQFDSNDSSTKPSYLKQFVKAISFETISFETKESISVIDIDARITHRTDMEKLAGDSPTYLDPASKF